MIIDITPKVDKKAPLGKAIHYWTRQQPSLRAFLDDGRFPISNAHVERLLRVVSTFRNYVEHSIMQSELCHGPADQCDPAVIGWTGTAMSFA